MTKNELFQNILGFHDGLPGIVAKMEIGTYDLYLKTIWYEGSVIGIDVTLSRGHQKSDRNDSVHEVSLEISRYDLARSWIESECRMASKLLQTGVVEIDVVIDEWLGVEGFPSGYCPQIPASYSDDENIGMTFQRGPLHAVAMLLKNRLPDWTRIMKVQ